MSFWDSVTQGLNNLGEVTKDIVKEIAEPGSSDEDSNSNAKPRSYRNELQNNHSGHYEDQISALMEENTRLKEMMGEHEGQFNNHPSNSGPEVKRLKKEIDTLKTSAALSKKEVEGYRKKIRKLERNDAAKSAKSALAASEKEKNSLIEQLNAAKKDFNDRASDLQERIKELERTRPPEGSIPSLQAGQPAMTEEIQNELTELREFKARIEEEGTTPEETRRTIDRLKSETKELNKQLVESRLKAEMLSDNLAAATTAQQPKPPDSSEMERKLERREKEFRSKRKSWEKERKETAKQLKRLKEKVDSVDLIQDEMSELTHERDALQEQLQKSEDERTRLRERMDDFEKHRDEMKKIEAEFELEREELMEQLRASEDRSNAAEEAVAEAIQGHQELLENAQRLTEENERTKAQLDQEIRARLADGAAGAEVERMRAALEEAEHRADTAEQRAVAAQSAAEKLAEHNRAAQEVAARAAEAELRAAEAEASQKTALRQLEDTRARANAMEGNVKALEFELNRARMAEGPGHAATEGLERALAQERRAKSELEAKYRNAKASLKKTRREKAALEQENDQLAKAGADADETKYFEDTIKKLREENSKLENIAEAARCQALINLSTQKEFTRFKAALLDALRIARERSIADENKIQTLEASMANLEQLEADFASLQDVLEDTRADLAQARQMSSKSQSNLSDGLKEKVKALEAKELELGRTKLELTRSQLEKSQLQEKITGSEKRVNDLTSKFNALQTQLASTKGPTELSSMAGEEVQRVREELRGELEESRAMLDQEVQRAEALEVQIAMLRQLENAAKLVLDDLGETLPPQAAGPEAIGTLLAKSLRRMKQSHGQFSKEQSQVEANLTEQLYLARQQISELNQANTKLLGRNDEVELACDEREAESERLHDRVNELEAALEQARMSTQDLLEEERQISEDLHKKTEGMENEIKMLEIRNKELKKTLEDKSREAYKSDVDALAKHKDVQRKYELMTSENESLKENLRNRHSKTQEDLSAKEGEIARLSRIVTQNQFDYEALKSYSADYSQVKQDRDEKAQRLEKAQQALQNLEGLVADTEKEKSALQDRVAELDTSGSSAERRLQAALQAAEKTDSLQKEVKSFRSKQAQAAQYILKLQRENEKLKEVLQSETLSKLQTKQNDYNVDRRVINKFLVTFFNHFNAGKPTDEVLGVLSNILHFSKEERTKIGLNRRVSQSNSYLGSVINIASSFIPGSTPDLVPLQREAKEGKGNMADLWVKFLLAEAGVEPVTPRGPGGRAQSVGPPMGRHIRAPPLNHFPPRQPVRQEAPADAHPSPPRPPLAPAPPEAGGGGDPPSGPELGVPSSPSAAVPPVPQATAPAPLPVPTQQLQGGPLQPPGAT